MKRWIKMGFILSVLLNVVLIVGILWARTYVRCTTFKLAAMNCDSQANFAEFVLDELESGDPARIQTLKKQLAGQVEQGRGEAKLWRSASQK